VAFCFAGLLGPPSAAAQQPPQQQGPPTNCMPGMKMPGCPDDTAPSTSAQHGTGLMTMRPQNLLQAIVSHAGSGTSLEPMATQTPMLMRQQRGWMLMLHGNGFLVDEQQSGPRGNDKFFSTNWFMGMAQREAGPGVFTARAMFSLEPATVTKRLYPLLFQQGERAFGRPIADGQHPHDLFMELALLYDWAIDTNALLSFYAAPLGDPALGPVAYGHRASAAENPLAALAHHQQDSTHVAADVITVGFAYKVARIEASGFHGREPDENRWNIDQGAIDSWSTRLTVAPGKNWSGQFSYGRIRDPEGTSAADVQTRMTGSVMYNRPLRRGNWASAAVWGRTRSEPDRVVFNSYLVESTLRFLGRNAVWTRIENVDRSAELLHGATDERPVGRVQAYTFGYDREFSVVPHVSTAIGAQVSVYGVPDALRAAYGARPAGVTMFVRLRPFAE
jgi:hypothetical protein